MTKSGKTKPRTDSVYGRVDVGDDRTLTVNYDFATDSIEIVGADPESTRTERRYERASEKPKVVCSIPARGANSFDANQAIFAYDWAVAIDTNDFTHGAIPGAVCFSYYAQIPPRGYSGGIVYRPLDAFLILGVKAGVNAERIGWDLTFRHSLSPHDTKMGKIAIVVDSELGQHEAINARSVGYYEEHQLPENMTLLYASSDTDKETLSGVMIRMCDKSSRKIIKDLADRQSPIHIHPRNGDRNFVAYTPISFLRVAGPPTA